MKIKVKKVMNLPQLIEWAWDNPELSRNKRFVSKRKDFPYINQYVIFNEVGYAEIENRYCYGRNDLFTVEEEVEITEDTELNLIERFIVDNETYYTNPQELSINTCLEAATDDITPTHFYIENEDRELMLIWRDGKMVE